MNKQESDIVITIKDHPGINQRDLSNITGHSLGTVNQCVRSLADAGLIEKSMKLSKDGEALLKQSKPKNAVILAAGYGMRMVPINLTVPKAMLEIHHETLIERLIKQLNQAGINDISIVVGFMKESFDYLIDEYGVKLVINTQYGVKNNLHSLSLAADRIGSTYIVPSDIWCSENPFRSEELYSWYMLADTRDPDSSISYNRKKEIVAADQLRAGTSAIGISYITEKDADIFRKLIIEYDSDPKNDNEFWEKILLEGTLSVYANIVAPDKAVEINTYEQLRDLDRESGHLKSDVIDVIKDVFNVNASDIKNISVLKKGMTNRSFLFSVKDEKFIMRIPGEGTDRLINRANEAKVYEAISGKGFCDDPVYINPDTGYKITKYLNDIRTADAENEQDLIRCMAKLRSLHEMGIKVEHSFDIFGQIEFYEQLRGAQGSVYRDYEKTKDHVWELKDYIDSADKKWTLTHIDAVADNFLFYRENGCEKLQLTDWEYSGMQDPHVDIAMFCIYSYFDKPAADHLIDLYFEERCDRRTRLKIYCYIAACGLLWSNWSEYKHALGIEFGEYGMRQYRYAKDFYRYAIEGINSEQ